MEKYLTTIRRFADSYGVVVPMEVLENMGIGEGAEVRIVIQKDKSTKGEDIFGILKEKLNKETSTLMMKVHKTLWPDKI